MLVGASGAGLAQDESAPGANLKPSASPPALLMRVDDGIFQLRQGQSIDLTDRKVLLTFVNQQNRSNMEERKEFQISMAGNGWSAAPGKRIVLNQTGLTEFNKIFKDKEECFLDIIDLVAPKGAPPTATFRLSCL